jgi:hypothetical protein
VQRRRVNFILANGHISAARQAVSHKNIIYCYDVPTIFHNSSLMQDNKQGYLLTTHTSNLNRWKKEIKSLFDELGNKRIKDIQSRVNAIANHISKLEAYCKYFSVSIKDKELKDLLKLAKSDNFIEVARSAKEKANELENKKRLQAIKAYSKYLDLWRKDDSEGIKAIPEKTKTLINWYANSQNQFTYLKYNTAENRVETSKGVQIPAEVAKRAFIQLNGCMEGACKDINVPVLHYTITETTKDYIKAGCHTIPKSDINYIAKLLKWN